MPIKLIEPDCQVEFFCDATCFLRTLLFCRNLVQKTPIFFLDFNFFDRSFQKKNVSETKNLPLGFWNVIDYVLAIILV